MPSHMRLSDRLLAHADALQAIAHAVAAHDAALANRLISHAAQAGLMHLGAQTIERDLARANRTVAEIHANDLEEAAMADSRARTIASLPPASPCATALAAIAQRHRRARIIADILGPVLGRGSLAQGRGPRP